MEGKFINERLQKIDDEIVKTKAKIATLTAKLRKLESEKDARKNAEFLAVLNGMKISPEELTALLQEQKEKSGNIATEPPNTLMNSETIKNDKEDTDENI